MKRCSKKKLVDALYESNVKTCWRICLIRRCLFCWLAINKPITTNQRAIWRHSNSSFTRSNFVVNKKLEIQIQFSPENKLDKGKWINQFVNPSLVVRCSIWYHLCNLKNVKNTRRLQIAQSITPHHLSMSCVNKIIDSSILQKKFSSVLNRLSSNVYHAMEKKHWSRYKITRMGIAIWLYYSSFSYI